jgi:hypothetical protein
MIRRGMIDTAITALNYGIDSVTDYVKSNGMAIVGLLTLVWFFKKQCTEVDGMYIVWLDDYRALVV